ncbi:MAG: excinuclease ABC subunit UvrA [Candidatus Eisenbacteria bacterium]|nr:excinuclease ABC subunit UvrA [Candidatus Eisenbacteria bacterium]
METPQWSGQREVTPPEDSIPRLASRVPSAPYCELRGVRTHNLKAIDCHVPFGRLTVISGVSGSGKSSLAFDTIYAEGQRRFVDCLSTYARQFLPRLDRPDADRIGELQPPVAVRQQNLIRNARSTVGTITEVANYLELLVAHAGTHHCVACGAVAEALDLDQSVARLLALPADSRWILCAPVPPDGASGGVKAKTRSKKSSGVRKRSRGRSIPPTEETGYSNEVLASLGFTRFLVDGEIQEEAPKGHDRLLVIDRLAVRGMTRQRATEAIEAGWRMGQGTLHLFAPGGTTPQHTLRRGVHCGGCGARTEILPPHGYSPHSPLGACAACQGFGRVGVIDRDKVVPDPSRSLRAHALVPFGTAMAAEWQRKLETVGAKRGIRLDLPYRELTAEEQAWVWSGDKEFRGVEGFFRYLDRKRYRPHVRIFQARFRGYLVCPECRGSRRRQEALAVRLDQLNLQELESLPIDQLAERVDRLDLSTERRARVAPLLHELSTRLRYLLEVGLDYLSLSRTARTLSGGETQRIRLATGLGSALAQTLYVLDEPTVGLHAGDTARLLGVMRSLCARGNTVLVVEHDPEIVAAADHLILLGPSGGEAGGELLYEGPPAEFFARHPGYFVADSGAEVQASVARESAPRPELLLQGIRHNNLEIEQLALPLDRMVVLTGLSGSGKSSLLEDVLWKQIERHFGRAVEEVGALKSITGLDALLDVVLLSQDPLGRSSRSTIVSFMGLLDPIRALLARSPAAKRLRLKPGAFSFNVEGGRCEICRGMGRVTIEMQFLADVEVVCESCRGRRFKEKVLEVTWRGRNILQMLDLSVAEAREAFAEIRGAAARVRPLEQVGLEYLRLGQSTATLSGGEAQRLRIASFLAEETAGRKLFLLDEPTSGLHPRDIRRLLDALRALLDRGHAVVAVEHQLDFIRAADWIVDLGPGGGRHGGQLLYSGPRRGFEARQQSATALALRGR